MGGLRRGVGLILFGSIVLLIGCKSQDQALKKDCREKSVFCVGLVTDAGKIDDKSFNQSAWEALIQHQQDRGMTVKYIETRDAKDYLANIDLFAREGYDMIVTVGFGLSEATRQAAQKYPEVNFVGIDQFQAAPLKNLCGLIFHEKRAGFQAGALAALLSKTKIIAGVFGSDLVPPVVAFKSGYEAGARYIDPEIKMITTYHPGGLETAFMDPEWGATTAKQALDQGADVLFAAGGTTGNGALIEVASHPGKFCIGVDSDQYLTLLNAQACLVSSATKKITEGVYHIIEKGFQGDFPSGNYYGQVGLASFHTFDESIPPGVKKRLKDIEQGLIQGTIGVQ